MKYIGIAVLALLVLFILVLIANTIKVSVKARKLTPFKKIYNDEEIINYANRLKKMIECKTVSVKDEYDDSEFLKLRNVMSELFPLVHEKCEKLTFSDDCWIYKLSGKDKSHNIMIMSHHDVAPVSGEWEHGGFSGEIADGKIWGRGTVDTKTPLFAEFQALEELLKDGFMPPCNLYIGSSHNEEIAGDGIPLALQYFKKNNIEFDVILDEGGAIIDPPLGGMKCDKCAMIAVHEKGRHSLICTASEGSSHTGLSANINTPVARIAAFITEINTKNIFIHRLYPEVKEMFSHLCPYTPFIMKLLFSNLWCFGGIIKAVMPKLNPQAGAMVGTACAFNEIESSKDKKSCTVKAFLRCVNDEDLKIDLENFKAIAKKYDITIKDGEGCEYHAPADMTKPQFEYTKKCAAQIFPQVAVAPFILPAGTDARHLTDVCKCVLRFAPIDIDNKQFASVHSENENINLDAVANAVAFYKHFLKNYEV
ncbi:MAG: M20/M25/M40 family metallo-hydrolase [Oscillospiraceae bacterium]